MTTNTVALSEHRPRTVQRKYMSSANISAPIPFAVTSSLDPQKRPTMGLCVIAGSTGRMDEGTWPPSFGAIAATWAKLLWSPLTRQGSDPFVFEMRQEDAASPGDVYSTLTPWPTSPGDQRMRGMLPFMVPEPSPIMSVDVSAFERVKWTPQVVIDDRTLRRLKEDE